MTIGAALRVLGVSSIVMGAGAGAQHGGAPAAAAARARARDAALAANATAPRVGDEQIRETVGSPAGPDGMVTVFPAFDPASIGAGDPFAGVDAPAVPGGQGSATLSPDGAAAIVRASQNGAGVPSNQSVTGLSISADGRYVAFASRATNLVTPDTNGKLDIFVSDLQTGSIWRVSDGIEDPMQPGQVIQSNGDSYDPAISGDGQWVVFTSGATNLVENDTNGVLDIFVVSRTGGGMRRANVNRLDQQTVGDTCNGCPNTSSWPSISGDGRYVTFWSSATNLVEYPPKSEQFHGRTGTYIKDLETEVVEYVNVRTGGDPLRDHGAFSTDGYYWGYGRTAISSDGNHVMFYNLAGQQAPQIMDPTMQPNGPPSTPGGSEYWFQPYVRDRQTGATRQAARAPGGGHPNGGTNIDDDPLSVSNSGQRAVFNHFASNLVPNDTNGKVDVFLFEPGSLSTRRVSLLGAAQQLEYGHRGVISGDGRFVAFRSGSVMLRKLDSPEQTTTMSTTLYGVNVQAFYPSISSTGQYVAFVSSGVPMVLGPSPGGVSHAYRRDRLIGIAEGEVVGRVYDYDTGNAIVGAQVEAHGRSDTTGVSGGYFLDQLPPLEVEITASAPGYHPKAITATLSGNSAANVTFRLKRDRTGTRPDVVEVYSHWSGPDRRTYFMHGAPCPQTFHAVVDWNGQSPGRVVFITPQGEFDGHFYSVQGSWQYDFNMGVDFGPGGQLRVKAITADGIVSGEYLVNMRVVEIPSGQYWAPAFLPNLGGDSLAYSTPSISFNFESVGVERGTVPSAIPLFGGGGCKWGLPGVPLSGSFKGDGSASLKVSYGASLSYPTPGLVDLFEGWSASFSTSAAMTWKLQSDETNWTIGGDLSAGFSESLSIPPKPVPFVIPVGPVPVPAFWQATASFGWGVSAGISGIGGEQDLQFTAALNLDPLLSLTGTLGVGVSLVNVYGSISGGARFGLNILQGEPQFPSFSIFLAGSIGAQVGPFKFEQPLFESTWSLIGGDSSPVFGVTPGLVDRDYFLALGGGNRFVANSAEPESPRQASQPSATDGAVGQTVETPIEQNVFNESKAALLALGNDLLMVWQKDDPTRTPINRLELTWSYFSAATQMWSVPAAVADDATADLRPQLAKQPDGTVLCAWEDLKETLAEPADPMDPAQVQAKYEEFKTKTEISVAVFNPATQTWSPATRLTDNALFEHSPKPSVASGGAAVVMWVSNTFGNEIGSVAQPNSVWAAWRAKGAWQAPGEIATNVPSIIKSVALLRPDDASQAWFAYSADTDGDPVTIEDWELFSIEWNAGLWKGPFQQTFNSSQEVGPSGACWGCYYSGVNVLWAELPPDGGTYVYLGYPTGGFESILSLPHAAASAGDLALSVGPEQYLNYIVFQDQSDDLVDLSYFGYDPIEGFWSAPRRLTADRPMEVPTALAITDSRELVLAYNKTAMGSETRIVNVEGEKFQIEVPVREGTDLYLLRHAIHAELAIGPDDIAIDPPNPLPGYPITITATLHNLGDVAAWGGAFDVAFYVGDPNNGGVPLSLDERIGGTAIGGSTGVAEFASDWPWGVTSLDIYVVVDPSHEWPDGDRSNNVAHRVFTVFPDMTVQSVTTDTIGPTDREIVVRVQNAGAVESPATTCVVREQEASGAALVTLQVPPLPPGAFADLPWVWPDSANLPGGSFALSASVDEENLIDEFDETNNATTAAANNNLPPTVSCPGDANGDGTVDFLDLNIVLSAYGTSGPPGSIPGDLDDDGDCDFVDLNIVLSNYGTMC